MMFEFSTSEAGLVKYPYDEQLALALILAFLVRSLVSESAALDTTFRPVQQTRRVSKESAKNSVNVAAKG
jgi:hypothetical protein